MSGDSQSVPASARRLAVARALTVALELMATPPVLGALLMLLLASVAAGAPVVGDHEAALGAQAQEIAAIVQKHFASDIRRVTVALGAAAAFIGLVLGLAAGILVDVRDAMRDRTLPKRSRLVRAFALTAFLELWFVLEGMARRPQLYADEWYAHGGLRRTVQVLVTDHLGPTGVALGGALLLILYGTGLPQTRGALWSRLRDARALLAKRLPGLGACLGVFALGPTGAPSGSSSPPPASALPAPKSGGASMNVLVIAADSLRADRLVPRTMPATTKLAGRGARFERAYVSLPRTFPSWVTLLTGRYPHKHGIRTMFPTWDERARDFDALPTRFARAGYRTAVVSDYAGDIFGRIDLGFQNVDTPTFDFGELIRQRALERETPLLPFLDSGLGRSAFPVLREFQTAADPELLAKDAIRAIGKLEDGPFFLTVFFSAAHFPYAAAHPHYRRFTDPAYRGRFKYHKPVGLASETDLDVADVRQIRGLYDGAVSAIDIAIDIIVRDLESRKLRERTIIVVTADHGETLFEQGRWHGHGDHLFGDESTHVPLVVVDPRQPGRVVPSIVRDVDLAPTLYALAGVTPPDDLDGRSLRPAVDGQALGPALAYAETELWMGDTPGVPESLRMPVPPVTRMLELDAAHGNEIVLRRDVRALTTMARHRMIRDERYKLLYMPTRERADYRLFDTQTDPDEALDVAAAAPAELERLKRELWSFVLADRTIVRRGEYLVPIEP